MSVENSKSYCLQHFVALDANILQNTHLLLFDNQQTESATQHSTQALLTSVCKTGMS